MITEKKQQCAVCSVQGWAVCRSVQCALCSSLQCAAVCMSVQCARVFSVQDCAVLHRERSCTMHIVAHYTLLFLFYIFLAGVCSIAQ